MSGILYKLKPKRGLSYVLHLGLSALLPFILFILIKLQPITAILMVIVSKWRIFAVRPRYWLPNIRANGVDLIVAFSYLIFIYQASNGSGLEQLLIIALYVIWLTVIKPRSSSLFIGLQAVLGQFIGLMALFSFQSSSAPALWILIVGGWLICYLSARHFFTIFDEAFSSLYSHTWGYFAGALIWILGHWLIYYYGAYAQPVIILTVLGIGLSGLYYLKQNERLSTQLKRQIIIVMVAVTFVVVFLSNWSSKSF
ncbi:MAG TPA: hypothetical protein VMR76_02735 [Candidatus Saccharimonadia bacterium]|nr:hypothetical protein [Candidatus Saccharimonadia bacterium]